MGAILTALVGVVNEPLRRTPGGHGPEEGLTDQIPGQPLSHRVANDIAGKQVLMAC